MPLLFRESPLNSIWEGSGSVNALDVLRAIRREPETLDAWIVEVGLAQGENRHLDAAFDTVLSELADVSDIEGRARRIAALMAMCLQASLLLRLGDQAVADAFCASRLGGDWVGAFGTLPPGPELSEIAQRSLPA